MPDGLQLTVPPKREFVCPAGHRDLTSDPFVITRFGEDGSVIRFAHLCADCFFDWFAKAFPAEEVLDADTQPKL